MDAPVVIASQDADFAGTVALHVKNELKQPCVIVVNKKDLKQYIGSALVLITTDAVKENSACPVINIAQPPVKMQDLLDDIESIRHRSGTEEVKLSAEYSLLVRHKQLSHTASGKVAMLTDTEVRLLQYLAHAKGQLAAKDQLLKDVWGFGETIDTHTLETHIYRLRGKFRDLSGNDGIEAAEGGYRLIISLPP